jgi:hypothetical protein
MRSLKPALLGLVVSLHACGEAPSHNAGSSPAVEPLSAADLGVPAADLEEVPPEAPDSFWGPAFDSANIALDENYFYMRNIVLVEFKPYASHAQRAKAIRWIGGTVVGGYRDLGEDGIYMVLITDDGTSAPLRKAIAELKRFPWVVHAAYEEVLAGEHG